jgi:prepilin-type N-terminal cleavage/methylation domain-containing protein
MKRKLARGFSLLELLIVVAIIAIVSGIVIYNYYISVQRARQKRTMADIRAIAGAWEARATDYRSYNAGFTFPSTALSFNDMEMLLAPTYMKVIPDRDGWGHALEFGSDQAAGAAKQATIYSIRSAGGDGIYQGSSYTIGTVDKFECDIVYSNGVFIAAPASH